MNHHESKEGKTGTHKHSPLHHMMHMIICCGLPILIIVSLPFIAKYNLGLATFLGVIAPFICPIMMGGMMLTMLGGKKKEDCCSKKESDTVTEE